MDKHFNVLFFLLLAAGIYLAKSLFLSENAGFTVMTAVVLLLALLLNKQTRIVSVMLISGMTIFTIHNLNHLINRNITTQLNNQKIQISGTIKKIKKKAFTTSIILATDRIGFSNQAPSFSLKTNFSIYLMRKSTYMQGDSLTVSGIFQRFEQKSNLHDFDFSSYAFNQKIMGQLTAVKIIKHSASASAFNSLYCWIEKQFNSYLSYRSANFQKALLLGSKDKLERQELSKFSNSGTIHLLAVSGLHVSFLVLIILFIKRTIHLNHYVFISLLLTTLTCYTILTGASPSVIRASLMVFVVIASYPLHRILMPDNILASAGILALCWDPNQLFSLGFILSYTAVFSIITIFLYLSRLQLVIKTTKTIGSLPSAALNTFLVSLSVSLGTLPVVMYIFGRYNFASLAANIVLLPLTAISYFCSVILLIVNKIPILAEFVAYCTELIDTVILSIVDVTANLTCTMLIYRFDSQTSLLLATIIIYFMTLKIVKMKMITLSLISLLLISLTLRADNDVRLYAFSLPSSATLLINTGSEIALISDGLRTSNLSRSVVPHLLAENIKTINYLIFAELNKNTIEIVEILREKFKIKKVIAARISISGTTTERPDPIPFITPETVANILKLSNSRIYFIPSKKGLELIYQHGSNSFLFTANFPGSCNNKKKWAKYEVVIFKKNGVKTVKMVRSGSAGAITKSLQIYGGQLIKSNGTDKVTVSGQSKIGETSGK